MDSISPTVFSPWLRMHRISNRVSCDRAFRSVLAARAFDMKPSSCSFSIPALMCGKFMNPSNDRDTHSKSVIR
ncbi:hypothetical protein D3C72_2046360 [compost metagenome]